MGKVMVWGGGAAPLNPEPFLFSTACRQQALLLIGGELGTWEYVFRSYIRIIFLSSLLTTSLSPHYARKKQGLFFGINLGNSIAPKSIKDP